MSTSVEPMDVDEVTLVAMAIAVRAAALVEVEIPEPVLRAEVVRQLDIDLFELNLEIGDTELDSLALVGLLSEIESDLDLSLFDREDDLDDFTLRDLCEYVIANVTDQRRRAFLASR